MSKVPSRKECQQFFTSLDKTGDGKLQPRELVSAMVLEGFNEKEVMVSCILVLFFSFFACMQVYACVVIARVRECLFILQVLSGR
jgi:hypothetical protein